jgi:hypothetical protein
MKFSNSNPEDRNKAALFLEKIGVPKEQCLAYKKYGNEAIPYAARLYRKKKLRFSSRNFNISDEKVDAFDYKFDSKDFADINEETMFLAKTFKCNDFSADENVILIYNYPEQRTIKNDDGFWFKYYGLHNGDIFYKNRYVFFGYPDFDDGMIIPNSLEEQFADLDDGKEIQVLRYLTNQESALGFRNTNLSTGIYGQYTQLEKGVKLTFSYDSYGWNKDFEIYRHIRGFNRVD